ncbi:hypothetical protein QE152_g36776 [Popillia japonica]|uniref:F-box domain-containing protein n=1 Tax=Popillia japonica TaxID=7064 RepID=A0AAW1IC97_POPJA
MLPSEAIERILSFCDGKTLYNARHVNDNWSELVDYLTLKTDIWKYCCYEEIPTDQLIEYLEKFNVSPSSNKYKDIYENWLAWQNITDNIDFDTMLCPADVPRITCLAASGRFIAVGSEDGKVRLYNDSWDLLFTTRHVAVKVLEITFFDDDRDLYMGDVWPVIIISYKCSTLYLMDYEDRFIDPLIVHDVKLYSVYKKYLCLVKTGGRISIVEWRSIPEGGKRLLECTYVRIYSPNEVTGVSMWDGICLLLMNSDVKTLKYDMQPITTVEKKTKLKFCIKNNIRMAQTCQIFRRNIIIIISMLKSTQTPRTYHPNLKRLKRSGDDIMWSAINELQKICESATEFLEDELEIFDRYVAKQLRNMNIIRAVENQVEIGILLSKARIQEKRHERDAISKQFEEEITDKLTTKPHKEEIEEKWMQIEAANEEVAEKVPTRKVKKEANQEHGLDFWKYFVGVLNENEDEVNPDDHETEEGEEDGVGGK